MTKENDIKDTYSKLEYSLIIYIFCLYVSKAVSVPSISVDGESSTLYRRSLFTSSRQIKTISFSQIFVFLIGLLFTKSNVAVICNVFMIIVSPQKQKNAICYCFLIKEVNDCIYLRVSFVNVKRLQTFNYISKNLGLLLSHIYIKLN